MFYYYCPSTLRFSDSCTILPDQFLHIAIQRQLSHCVWTLYQLCWFVNLPCPLLYDYFCFLFHNLQKWVFFYSFNFLPILQLWELVYPYWHTVFDLYNNLCQIVSNVWEVLIIVQYYWVLWFLYPFIYCRMERKHQDEIVFLKFVRKDNFDIGI
jgi:hypothetical protein